MSTDTLTHAKTEHQLYAWAIAAGHCPIINSTVRPPLGMVGALIGIHAGKVGDSTPTMIAEAWKALPPALPRGALIGVARLVGVVRERFDGDGEHNGFRRVLGKSFAVGEDYPVDHRLSNAIRPWWRGPWGWLLEEAVLLPEPIPMRGQQGLWRIPDMPVRESPSYDCEVGAFPMTVAQWALEQWRKAREGA